MVMLCELCFALGLSMTRTNAPPFPFSTVWDYDVIGSGKFLGCVVLTGQDLKRLFEAADGTGAGADAGTGDDGDNADHTIHRFPLSASLRLDRSLQSIAPKGILSIQLSRPSTATGPGPGGGVVAMANSIGVMWDGVRNAEAGGPYFELGGFGG